MTVFIRDIVRHVANEWGFESPDLLLYSRQIKYVEPRKVAMLIACRMGHSHSAIGRAMKRHSATVSHGCATIEEKIPKSRNLRRSIEQVTRDLLEGV